jgi:hypothetical protein
MLVPGVPRVHGSVGSGKSDGQKDNPARSALNKKAKPPKGGVPFGRAEMTSSQKAGSPANKANKGLPKKDKEVSSKR